MAFSITQLHHVSIIVSDTPASLKFYVDVLGFEIDDSRPDLGFPGAWIRAGNVDIHLLEVPNPDRVAGRPGHGGRDRHIAFAILDLEGLKSRLDEYKIPYTLSKSGRAALFCRDLDGNALEFIESKNTC